MTTDHEEVAEPLDLTWQQYEILVAKHLEEVAKREVKVTVTGKRDVPGASGEFEIDATAEFELMGIAFFVVIECKNYRRPVGRDVVMTLWAKLQEVAGHKGAVFSTSGFQRGAIEYAVSKSIALIQLTPTGMVVVNKAAGNLVHGMPVCKAEFIRSTEPGITHISTDHHAATTALLVSFGWIPPPV